MRKILASFYPFWELFIKNLANLIDFYGKAGFLY